MTSFAFILGVLPLVVAGGAGAVSRHSIGTGVFAGMLVATLVGIFFIPLFFSVIAGLSRRRRATGRRRREERPRCRALRLLAALVLIAAAGRARWGRRPGCRLRPPPRRGFRTASPPPRPAKFLDSLAVGRGRRAAAIRPRHLWSAQAARARSRRRPALARGAQRLGAGCPGRVRDRQQPGSRAGGGAGPGIPGAARSGPGRSLPPDRRQRRREQEPERVRHLPGPELRRRPGDGGPGLGARLLGTAPAADPGGAIRSPGPGGGRSAPPW